MLIAKKMTRHTQEIGKGNKQKEKEGNLKTLAEEKR